MQMQPERDTVGNYSPCQGAPKPHPLAGIGTTRVNQARVYVTGVPQRRHFTVMCLGHVETSSILLSSMLGG